MLQLPTVSVMYGPTLSFHNVFYNTFRVVLDLQKLTTPGLWQWLNLFGFFWALRVPYFAYVVHGQFTDKLLLRHDLVLGIIHNFRAELDYTTILMLYTFDLIYFAIEYWLFRLDPLHKTWRLWWALTVGTVDEYCQKCRPSADQLKSLLTRKEAEYRRKLSKLQYTSLLLPISVQQYLVKQLAAAAVAYRLEGANWRRLTPVALLPRLSLSIRQRCLRTILRSEAVTYYLQWAIWLLFWATIVGSLAVYPNLSRHSVWSMLYAAAELTAACYVLLSTVRYAIVLTTYNTLTCFIYTGHILSEWRRLIKVQKRLCSFLPRSLFRFLIEHNQICYHVTSGSELLSGKTIFATLCTQIPCNVVLVRAIVFQGQFNTPPWLQVIMALIVLFQLLLCLAVFLPLSWCHTVYHLPKRFIPQLLLINCGGRGWTRIRLKYDDLYGRLTRGPKIGCSVGPLHAITYKTSVEVEFMYYNSLLLF